MVERLRPVRCSTLRMRKIFSGSGKTNSLSFAITAHCMNRVIAAYKHIVSVRKGTRTFGGTKAGAPFQMVPTQTARLAIAAIPSPFSFGDSGQGRRKPPASAGREP